MAKQQNRIQIRDPGEYYRDVLKIEAYLKGGRALGEEACNLLCARLMQRREIRQDMLNHLAMKRGITADELVLAILADSVPPVSVAEMAELKEKDENE